MSGIIHLNSTTQATSSHAAPSPPRAREWESSIFSCSLQVAQIWTRGGAQARRTDPTQVFERLCADILLSFWGGKTEYSGSLVFGTARKKSGHNHKFESNIEELCLKLQHEGGMKIGEKPPGAGDGKLDVVVWRVFPDRRAGGLSASANARLEFTGRRI